jgi:hypothetical protein
MTTRSSALVLAFAPLLVVGCGENRGNKNPAPALPDSSSSAADVPHAPNPDASPDPGSVSPTDGPVVRPDAPVDSRTGDTLVPTPDTPGDSRAVAADTGPAASPDAPADTRLVAIDTAVGATDAPADNRAVASDTGPAAPPDAPADTRPVVVDTGLAASADGGPNDFGPQPRVLVIDPATDQFLAYDRDGQPVHDYHATLAFADGYGNRGVWAQGVFARWDATADFYEDTALDSASHGLDEPLRRSRLVVWSNSTQGSTRAKLVTLDGSVVSDLALPGARTDLRLSPGQSFLYAANHTGDSNYCPGFVGTDAMVARIADGTSVWQGSLCSAVFARDDAHFMFSPDGCANPVKIVNLVGGEVTPVVSPYSCLAGMQAAVLQGAAPLGAVVSSDAWTLWFVDWQAKISPFTRTPTPLGLEYFLSFNSQGTAALWNEPGAEFDLASLTSHPWTGPDGNCYGRPDNSFLKRNGQSLQHCKCSDGSCALLATLPTQADTAWTPATQISPDGRFVFVSYAWGLNRMPRAGHDELLYSSTGELLLTVPGRNSGQIVFDQTGQLAVLTSRPWPSGPAELAIVSLSTFQVTSLPLPRGYGIVYE